MTDGLRLDVDGRIATLWLDRPSKRNAMNAGMWEAVPDLVSRAEADDAVRVLVVRGAGDHFCAGADITELGTSLASDSTAVAYRTLNARAEASLTNASVPSLAAIDGACIGGGLQLALSCDVRVATSRAVLAVPAGRLGISFPAASLERLVATVGAARARRLVLTSETLDATTALSIGLLDEVVSPDALDASIAAWCHRIATTSAVSQLAAKEMVAAIVATGSVPAALAAEWESIAAASADLHEGLSAFNERRIASFGPRPPRPTR